MIATFMAYVCIEKNMTADLKLNVVLMCSQPISSESHKILRLFSGIPDRINIDIHDFPTSAPMLSSIISRLQRNLWVIDASDTSI